MLHKNAVESTTLEILEELCLQPALIDFGLGGGTNIALRKGHRSSDDLDFFTDKPFNTSIIYKTLTSCFKNTELLFEHFS